MSTIAMDLGTCWANGLTASTASDVCLDMEEMLQSLYTFEDIYDYLAGYCDGDNKLATNLLNLHEETTIVSENIRAMRPINGRIILELEEQS